MDFMGIGWMEVLVILVLALIVLGPDKLPEISRSLGKTVREIRQSVNEATRVLTEEEPEDARRTREVLAAQRRGQAPAGDGLNTPPESLASPASAPASPPTHPLAPADHGEPKPPPVAT